MAITDWGKKIGIFGSQGVNADMLGPLGIGYPNPADLAAIQNDMMQTKQDMASLYASVAQSQQAQHHPAAQAKTSPREQMAKLASKARDQFVARMGGVRGDFLIAATDCIYTHVHEERVILFYFVGGGKTGVVEEHIDVFPSDTLIAQFRLIVNS